MTDRDDFRRLNWAVNVQKKQQNMNMRWRKRKINDQKVNVSLVFERRESSSLSFVEFIPVATPVYPNGWAWWADGGGGGGDVKRWIEKNVKEMNLGLTGDKRKPGRQKIIHAKCKRFSYFFFYFFLPSVLHVKGRESLGKNEQEEEEKEEQKENVAESEMMKYMWV